VKWFFDTTVLVAALLPDHPHHARSFPMFDLFKRDPDDQRRSWSDRLRAGLSVSRERLSRPLAAIVGNRALSEATLEELETALLAADVGVFLHQTFAALLWLFVSTPWQIAAAHYAPAQWVFLFLFSMISVLGAFSFYFLGLQYLEPTRAIIASCLEPVFSILLAALLLGEVLRPVQTLGIILVLGAIVIVERPDRAGAGEPVMVEPIE